MSDRGGGLRKQQTFLTESLPVRLIQRAALLLAVTLTSLPTHAATFTVTSTADSGEGSLREAITALNLAAGNTHSIAFNLPANSQINLGSELPAIAKPNAGISGAGAPGLRISGGGATRILRLASSNALFTMADITLAAGLGAGGAGCLYAPSPSTNGAVILTRVRFEGCRSDVGNLISSQESAGGALLSVGRSLTLDDCVFDQNRVIAKSGGLFLAYGGAVAAFGGNIVVRDSRFIENLAVGAASSIVTSFGGAIYATGGSTSMSINRTSFGENTTGATGAPGRGGAIFTSGNLLIENSAFLYGGSHFGLVESRTEAGNSLEIRNTTFFEAYGGEGAVVRSNAGTTTLRHVSFVDTLGERLTGTDLEFESGAARLSHVLFARGPTNRSNCSAAAGAQVQVQFSLSNRSAAGCGIPRTSADLGADIRLDYAAGPVAVVPLRAGGAAVDAGNPALPDVADWTRCMPRDARNVVRPQNGGSANRCDIGAYELQLNSIFSSGFEASLR